MSYYKRPELTIFDEEECKWFCAKNNKQFWKAFEYRLPYYYKNGMRIKQDPKELRVNVMRISGQLNTEIGLGVTARHVQNIYYISKTFRNAMDRCVGKLIPLTKEMGVYKSIHENCCIIDDVSTYVLYSTNDDNARMIHIFNGKAIAITDFLLSDDGISNIETLSFLDMEEHQAFGFTNEKYFEDKNKDLLRLETFYLYLLFKKYGNIEIEMVPRKKALKRSQILGEKVNNFMGIDVQVLDSRWFTTICRDEGFLVSGHLRLQPCKDENGNWTRRLIYINPYAKKGYHRLAPIVNLKDDG